MKKLLLILVLIFAFTGVASAQQGSGIFLEPSLAACQTNILSPVSGSTWCLVGGSNPQIYSFASGIYNPALTVTPQILVANDGATGTVVNKLVKLVGTPSTAALPLTTDTSGVIGICASGCGTTGNASIQISGIASCAFDGATVAGDYVGLSASVAGDCHDIGLTATPAQTVGRVFSTNPASGTYSIMFFNPTFQTSATAGSIVLTLANATTTGTVVNTLTKVTGAPSQAIVIALSETQPIFGICTSGCGLSGNATIQEAGLVTCAFDGPTTAGDVVQPSALTAGDCHDSGVGPATTGQFIGQVLSTQTAPGMYQIFLNLSAPSTNLSVNANAGTTTLTGTTTGNIICSMNATGSSWKRTLCFANAYENTGATPQTITYSALIGGLGFVNSANFTQNCFPPLTTNLTTLTLPVSMTSTMTCMVIVDGK